MGEEGNAQKQNDGDGQNGGAKARLADGPPIAGPLFTIGTLAVSLLVFALGAFSVVGVAWIVGNYTNFGANGTVIILPILLVYGVVTLVVALAVLAGILSYFNLAEPGKALGLPEGSIPAVIALILVLIFAIIAVFLSTIEIGEGGISEQFATQILTTTGTLAVAVAGFYFGTRAVETGATAMTGPAESGSVADELTKLDALRKSGALTEDEFQAQKKQLLGSKTA
jgi:Short C-terminal domain